MPDKASSLPDGQVRTITGMKGGLGRTLLSAFLLFAILPLAAISFLAVDRARRDLRQEVAARLSAVARLKETEIDAWTGSLSSQIEILAGSPASRQVFLSLVSNSSAMNRPDLLAGQSLQAALESGDLAGVGFFDMEGRLLASAGTVQFTPPVFTTPLHMIDSVGGRPVFIVGCAVQDDGGRVQGYLTGLADLSDLTGIMLHQTDLGETGEAYLVSPEFGPLTSLQVGDTGDSGGDTLLSMGIKAALAGQEGTGLYTGYHGRPVIGAYRWLPRLQSALVVEQSQAEAFARDDALATLLIGATLAVGLLATLLAALITRQLSRPIVQLTLSAVKIAGGDLEQVVPVERDDEIGILARAFNIMTTELRALYHNLEQKVAERTLQLREANQQLSYQAMQLALSVELGRVITSILDLDQLLKKVVELIRERFRLRQTAIYLLDENGSHIVRQANIGWDGSRIGRSELQSVHRESLMGQAIEAGEPRHDELRINIAIPLRAGQRVIGVLKLQGYRGDELAETDIGVLQSLGDQISVAIQNAQTYAVERGAVDRLRRLDEIRTQSLSSMSRELATSLNSIIGFSRLILKGVDGPLTDQQRSDVTTINRSGQHLQGLLDDILDLVDLENDEHPLEQTFVELGQVVANAIEQVSPLAENRSVLLQSRCAMDIPLLQADSARLQQALTYLVSNVVETAGKETVTVGVQVAGKNGSEVMVRIASGADASCLDGSESIEKARQGLSDQDLVWDGTDAGIKLILSKRIVELHGGCLWVSGNPSLPANFVFTLPVNAPIPYAGASHEAQEMGESIQ